MVGDGEKKRGGEIDKAIVSKDSRSLIRCTRKSKDRGNPVGDQHRKAKVLQETEAG